MERETEAEHSAVQDLVENNFPRSKQRRRFLKQLIRKNTPNPLKIVGRGGTFGQYPPVWEPRPTTPLGKRMAKKDAPNCFAIANQMSARHNCLGFSKLHCDWCSACRFRQVSAQERSLPNGCYSREAPFWPKPLSGPGGVGGGGSTYGLYPSVWEMPATEIKLRCGRRCYRDERVCQTMKSQVEAKWKCPQLDKLYCNWCSGCRWRIWSPTQLQLPQGCYARETPWTPDSRDQTACIKSGAPFCWVCKNGSCKQRINKFAIRQKLKMPSR